LFKLIQPIEFDSYHENTNLSKTCLHIKKKGILFVWWYQRNKNKLFWECRKWMFYYFNWNNIYTIL